MYLLKTFTPLFLTFFISYFSFSQNIISYEQAGQSVGTIYGDSLKINGKPFTGIVRDYFKNGKQKLWVEVKNGRANGEWIEWHQNGIMRYHAFWKDGKGHGRWQYFDEFGQLTGECFVIEDYYNGAERIYYLNGNLKSETFFVNNKKVGYSYFYNEDGSTKERNKYEDGKLVIDSPRLFAPYLFDRNKGIFDTNEWGITFLPDNKTAYFTSRKEGEKQKIYKMTLKDDKWQNPEIIPFSTDRDEAIYYDKKTNNLFFGSARSLTPKRNSDSNIDSEIDMNIWKINLNEQNKGKPIALSFNKTMRKGDKFPTNYETGAVTDSLGNLYFWTKSETGNDTDIFISKLKNGVYQNPISIGEPVNTKDYESSPCISPDGNYMIFARFVNETGFGKEDLFFSKNINGKWTTPQNLGVLINTVSNESFPSFSPDGKYFYFSSDREDKEHWKLYYLETRFLDLD